MFLQDLQLRDTVKYSCTQFFDFVFLKVPVINFNNTKDIKFRATRDYHSLLHKQEIQHRLHKLRASKQPLRANWSKLVSLHAETQGGTRRWGDEEIISFVTHCVQTRKLMHCQKYFSSLETPKDTCTLLAFHYSHWTRHFLAKSATKRAIHAWNFSVIIHTRQTRPSALHMKHTFETLRLLRAYYRNVNFTDLSRW